MYALSQATPPAELSLLALDSFPERICVLDRGGWIIFANRAWNHNEDDSIGRVRSGVGANYLWVCRSAIDTLADRAWRVAKGIEAVLREAIPQFTVDYSRTTASGQAWFRLLARPLRAAGAGAVVVQSEITGQVAFADKLRRTQKYCDVMIANPMETATILGAGNIVRYQSPASEAVLGLSPSELLGRQIFEFVHPEDAAAVRQHLRDCRLGAPAKGPCEYRFRNKDGSWRNVESAGRRISSSEDVVLNSRNITHQKLAEEALRTGQAALELRRDELQGLAARLFGEQERQHRALAAELNYLSQRLASMALEAPNLAKRDSAGACGLRDCVASLGRDLHQIADALHPLQLDNLGLAAALRDYLDRFARAHGITVHFHHRGISAWLPPHTAVTLYRIAEKALSNAAKHANAEQVWVTLSRNTHGLRLVVRDDGSGYNPADIQPGLGLGLLAIRERLRDIQGSLSTRSRAGGGTELVIVAPLTSTGNPLLTAPAPEAAAVPEVFARSTGAPAP